MKNSQRNGTKYNTMVWPGTNYKTIAFPVPNAFPDRPFNNHLCALVVSERSTDKQWQNPPGISSDCQGDPLE